MQKQRLQMLSFYCILRDKYKDTGSHVPINENQKEQLVFF